LSSGHQLERTRMPRRHDVLKYERDGDVLIVTPVGDSLRVEERVLSNEINALHELLESNDLQHVVVDIGSAPYFGSLILGSIIALCKRVTDTGGKAAMCNASEGMRESLQIMRIESIIPYYSTRDEALQAARE
jgi:anti-anti-sigma factor